MVSRQYLELSIPTLYASDLQTSVKWYQQICGFQLLEFASDAATMQVTPGVIFYLSTNEDSDRGFSFSTKRIDDLRTHLAENNIVIEEDHGHWIAFRDPDNNKVGAEPGGFGMDLLEITLPD
jgi:catechol 2,3-dioxygenase-like lactoylglutathione lyase family enzyme